MKVKLVSLVYASIFICSSSAFSDMIKLSDGSKVEGRILSSSQRYINIRKDDSNTVQILHSKIESIFFTWADMVYLISGETIKCKIVNRIPPNLHIVSSDGSRKIPLNKIKMYFYHSAEALEIPECPVTGPEFKNEKPFPPKDLTHNIYFGIQWGAHWAPTKDWMEDFMSAAWQYSVGIRTGYYITNLLSFGGGIEYDSYSHTHYQNIDSEVKTIFYYIGAEYAKKIGKNPDAYGFIGMNVGGFNTTGTLNLYSYREIEFNVNSVTFMPRIGVRGFLDKHLSLGVEAAYLFAKSGSISVPTGSDLVIDFSGFSTFLSVLYYF